MMQIKLNKELFSETGKGKEKSSPSVSMTIACPDHLVLADLPVGRSIGAPPAALLVKTVGRKAERSRGERVHLCLHCDFPIAVYGRLSPCDHAFCLDCAKSENSCYICEKNVEKIQSIKRSEPIFICSAELCLKSFLGKEVFESHVKEVHGKTLKLKQSPAAAATALDSTTGKVPPPMPKPLAFSYPIPVVQIHDRDDKSRSPLMRDHQPYPIPVPMMQQPRPPFFGPTPRLNNFSAPVMAFPPNGQQAFYGAPFDMGRLSLCPRDNEPAVFGLPPNSNLQARPWNMGQLTPPPPRGVLPMMNPRQPPTNHPPRQPPTNHPPRQPPTNHPPRQPPTNHPPSQPPMNYPPSQPPMNYPPRQPPMNYPPRQPHQGGGRNI